MQIGQKCMAPENRLPQLVQMRRGLVFMDPTVLRMRLRNCAQRGIERNSGQRSLTIGDIRESTNHVNGTKVPVPKKPRRQTLSGETDEDPLPSHPYCSSNELCSADLCGRTPRENSVVYERAVCGLP